MTIKLVHAGILAQVPTPTNLNLKAWAKLAVTLQEHQVVACITFGSPAGFEGPVPTPSTNNDSSARGHHPEHHILHNHVERAWGHTGAL